MRSLLILSLLTSNAFASTFIVEMQRPLTQKEIHTSKDAGLRVELFDQTNTEYFKRTYRIETESRDTITKVLPAKTVEDVHQAMHFSIRPAKDSKFLRSDELFSLQWGLYNQGQVLEKLTTNTKKFAIQGKSGIDIRWAESIAKIEDGLKKDPLVAVIDMGIDFSHPDLKNRIFKNTAECNEKGEIADVDEDRDNNGLAGDCMGWNFAAKSMYEARRPQDDLGHGTHISGIIAAETNNSGISGISSKIKILPIKVTGKVDLSSEKNSVQPLTDRIAKGILYATNMGADVINLSLGWTRSMDTNYLREALGYAISRGVVVVAAAGNNNNNASIFPCAHYDVICVGAVTIDGSMANFSNYGGEVDVLAPGDEIVSTIPLHEIPLQLNLQGFDVKSGTSQAAPHVSAIAALIRGNFPRMSPNEITRRILDSADQGEPGKSLHGLVNLKKSFELELLPSVKPVFKSMSVALYDKETSKFTIPLNIKNFGPEASDVVVALSSPDSTTLLNHTLTISKIRPGEILAFNIEGTLQDQMAHNQTYIDVKIKVPGLAEKLYRHEIRLARDAFKDKGLINVPFEFQNDQLPVGLIKDGAVRNLINTVETVTESIGIPEFYIPRSNAEKKLIEIRFFRPEAGHLKEAPVHVELPGAIQLLNVVKLDVNFDGRQDYLIRSVACEEFCSDPGKAKRYIQYTFWNNELNPLFGEKSLWKFLPTLVNVDLKSQRFLRVETRDFGPLAMPVFLETGMIPSSQQIVENAFSLPDLSVARRIYYLEPSINSQGNVDFLTKTISTTNFNDGIRKATAAHISDEVQTMHLLAQNEDDLRKGVVRALVSVGKGYLRKNFVVNLTDSKKLNSYSIDQNLWGYEHTVSRNLSNSLLNDSFSGLVSKSRLIMLQNQIKKSYVYDASSSVEVPLATIASFNQENSEYTFFQTPSYLMVADHSAEKLSFKKIKINRFSFLPGTLFNDSFYPVISKEKGSFIPALYVDETDIQNNLVSFTTYHGGTLSSPLKSSSFIPPICKAMNPVRLDKSEGHSLTMLCLENKKWTMKFMKFDD